MLEINNCPYLTPSVPVEAFYQILPDVVADFLDAGLDLNVMSKEEIIYRSKENPEFICQSAHRTPCQLLINEGADFNYIDSIRDVVDSWEPPKMQATPREKIFEELIKRRNLKQENE